MQATKVLQSHKPGATILQTTTHTHPHIVCWHCDTGYHCQSCSTPLHTASTPMRWLPNAPCPPRRHTQGDKQQMLQQWHKRQLSRSARLLPPWAALPNVPNSHAEPVIRTIYDTSTKHQHTPKRHASHTPHKTAWTACSRRSQAQAAFD